MGMKRELNLRIPLGENDVFQVGRTFPAHGKGLGVRSLPCARAHLPARL